MIKKLRRKFIFITAAALFAIILLVIAAINCVYIFQSGKMLESRLDQLLDSRGKEDIRPEDDGSRKKQSFSVQNPQNSAPGSPREYFRPFDMKLLIHPDGCLIILDGNGDLLEILQNSPEHYSEEELLTTAKEIFGQKKDSGWRQYFRFRRESLTLPDGTPIIKIALVNASADLYSVATMLLISVAVGLLSFFLVLSIVILASGKAVKPIAESYARQKQFVTDAGHELKTPLTVISADNELAKMIYGPSEWFDGIDSQVAKMNNLVRSLITLARMDEEQTPRFAPFNLSDAVYDTAKSFEKLIHSDKKLITFDIAEEIFCLGDESRLRQAVAILVDNAAKYCDCQGKISVRLTQEKQIRLQVANDYADAATLDLNRLFERFYRADTARTPDGSYGLGLSIAKSITELHKGEIQAKVPANGKLMFEIRLSPFRMPK